jgi:uncharacterized protein (TIGR02996 family)
MSDEAAFLNALRDDHTDATTRLVYADWLDDRGDARGEYLRLEMEMERIQARLQTLRQQLDLHWLCVVSPQSLGLMTMRSGRTITLEALDQRKTYAGLLAGTPDRESNDHHIRSALMEAERHCVQGARPHLIPPPRRDYRREPGDMQPLVDRSPHHIPEWIPAVQCIGSFEGTPRDPNMHLSVLTVVWFQDEYALPIREPALSQILDLDWKSLAVDVLL